MFKLTSRLFSKLQLVSGLKCNISSVAIVGAGQMGGGIAQVAAQTGHSVVLVDMSQDLLDRGVATIRASLNRVAKKKYQDDPSGAEKFVSETMKNISLSTDAIETVKTADIVIEAIIENLEIKQKLFSVLHLAAPLHTIFATNTSSLSVADIAAICGRRDRFGGLHFFNPVAVMKLLEVVRIPETSEETYQRMMNFGRKLGKETITCRDTPGFVVNRLLAPYVSEVLKMLERGDASAEDIDTAMKLGAGYPMGPVELLDYTGLDTNLFIRQQWLKRYPNDPIIHISPLVQKLVSEGKLGRKTGEGFYKYKK